MAAAARECDQLLPARPIRNHRIAGVDRDPDARRAGPPLDFRDRVAIVTGAGNGLGRAIAHELARLGAAVLVNDLGVSTAGLGPSTRAADFVVEEITRNGGTAIANHESAATAPGCRAIADMARAEFGRIDAVVLNAGIVRNAMLADLTDEDITAVVETNLLGPIYLSRAVWPTMVAQNYGRMVVISSPSGLFGRANGANYAAAKTGLLGLCNALAIEGEPHGIAANAVLPVAGLTRLGGAPDASDQSEAAVAARRQAETDSPRADPSLVASLVAYLASPECSRTHRYYAAVNGHYSRVFVGVGAGWTPFDSGDGVRSDDLVAHLGDIDDVGIYYEPMSMREVVRHAGLQHTLKDFRDAP